MDCRVILHEDGASRLLSGNDEWRDASPLGFGRHRQAEEDQDGLVEAEDVGVVQAADLRADFCFRHGRDFVHHQAAGRPQTITRVRLYGKPEQRRLRRVGGEGADGDGIGAVEAIVLNDDGGAGFARVVLAAGDDANVAAPHSSPRSDTASMKA